MLSHTSEGAPWKPIRNQDRLGCDLAAGLLTENGEYGLVSMETDSSSDSEKVRSNFTIVNSEGSEVGRSDDH
jgi:archaellum component FlaG (FlaF/FlaG flagellin family)